MQNQQTNSTKRNSSSKAANLGAAAYKGSDSRSESAEDTGVETGSRSSSQQSANSGEQKSIGTVIAQGLAKDTQESIDRVMGEVGEYYETGRSYIRENPREAAMIGVTIGMAAWALLFTKPGRRIFDRGAEMAVPELSRWFASNFGGGRQGGQQRSQAV